MHRGDQGQCGISGRSTRGYLRPVLMQVTIRRLSNTGNPVYSVGRRTRDPARLNRMSPIMRRSQTFADVSAVGLAVAAAAVWSGSACAAAHSAGDVTEARVTAETPGD